MININKNTESKSKQKANFKNIFLVRHTSLAIDKNICYGRSDIDVGESFVQEAQAVVENLGNLNNAKLISSPLTRTRKLAEFIASKNSIEKIAYSDDIVEIDFGNWEMKKWDDVDSEHVGRFFRNIVEEAPAGGESFSQVVKRANNFWQNVLALPNEKIVVVTHGGVLKAFMSVIAQIEPKIAAGFIFDYGQGIGVQHINGFNRILYVNG